MQAYSRNTINFIFISSLAYWILMAFHSTMLLGGDAEGYNGLGHLIAHNGWQAYFPTGPNREPAYPFLVALSIKLSSYFNIAYFPIQKTFHILILFFSQWLLWRLWRQINIAPPFMYLGLLYWALSPSITNSGMSLYSEILAYPIILLLIFSTHQLLTKDLNLQERILSSLKLSTLCLLLTSIKAVFEIVIPLLFVSLLILNLLNRSLRPRLKQLLIILSLSLVLFQTGIYGYKSINMHFNKHWAITDRGAWALYGNTARRMEPLTTPRFIAALAYIPGEGFCERVLDKSLCREWSSHPSDSYGLKASQTLANQGISPKEQDKALFAMTAQEIAKNPFQYSFLCALEGIKMFFWESTRIGFVQYPSWVDHLYQNHLLKNTLRLTVFLISFITFVISLMHWKRIPLLLQLALLVCLLFISIHAPFFILTRYSFVIVPLLLTIALYGLNYSIAGKNRNVHL